MRHHPSRPALPTHERREGDVQLPAHAAEEDAGQAVQRQQVDDEAVAAPRQHHVAVRQHAHHGVEQSAGVDGLGAGMACDV